MTVLLRRTPMKTVFVDIIPLAVWEQKFPKLQMVGHGGSRVSHRNDRNVPSVMTVAEGNLVLLSEQEAPDHSLDTNTYTVDSRRFRQQQASALSRHHAVQQHRGQCLDVYRKTVSTMPSRQCHSRGVARADFVPCAFPYNKERHCIQAVTLAPCVIRSWCLK